MRWLPGMLLVLLGCSNDRGASKPMPALGGSPDSTLAREPIEPLPRVSDVKPELARLGRRLFEDKRLSSDNTLACASCHDIKRGGVDGLARSVGVRGKRGVVNAPTVLNSSLNFAQFWDGRAATLEDQAGEPIANPLEMASDFPTVLKKLGQDAAYVRDFKLLFGDGLTEPNVRSAIAGYERTLITPGSPFDRWLEGDKAALGEDATAGYLLFKSVGCVACHQGRNVGGNMFQRFGVFGNYFKDRGNVGDADYGRFNVTRNESDRFVFRVPSLRNVARTAPYLHDGSKQTLPEVVQVMAKYQLGRSLDETQVTSIVAFLSSLSGPDPAEVGR
ncbi:MAG TPA: cytochrome-c peroxidase [Polyangiaceae bacterium]|nr:cytochrome-c peroxidase [Polyangiaceae bacterium]